MSIFFTADPHFGHSNIIRYCNRPFQTKEEHDETLIANWNSVVSSNSMTYILGDFGFGSPEWLRKIADRLNGKLCLIKGNHDKHVSKEVFLRRFLWIKDYHVMSVTKNQKIVMFHYAMRSWQFSNHGSIHLFGHSHGNLPPYGKSFDVGVDCWNYFPVSLDQVLAKGAELQLQFDYDKELREKELKESPIENIDDNN